MGEAKSNVCRRVAVYKGWWGYILDKLKHPEPWLLLNAHTDDLGQVRMRQFVPVMTAERILIRADMELD